MAHCVNSKIARAIATSYQLLFHWDWLIAQRLAQGLFYLQRVVAWAFPEIPAGASDVEARGTPAPIVRRFSCPMCRRNQIATDPPDTLDMEIAGIPMSYRLFTSVQDAKTGGHPALERWLRIAPRTAVPIRLIGRRRGCLPFREPARTSIGESTCQPA